MASLAASQCDAYNERKLFFLRDGEQVTDSQHNIGFLIAQGIIRSKEQLFFKFCFASFNFTMISSVWGATPVKEFFFIGAAGDYTGDCRTMSIVINSRHHG